MDAHGFSVCCPQPPDSMSTEPFLEITSGYAQRAAAQLPKQGSEGPWRTNMEYRIDRKLLREGPVDDDNLRFTKAAAAVLPEPALTG